MLPNDWENYLSKMVSPHEEVVLRIKEDADLGNLICSIGWSKRFWWGKEQAVFAPKGKALFSLAYDLSKNEVEICVRKAMESIVKNSALYGMLIALYNTCIGLHGATLQCGNKTVILSAPSGTGKTTLSNLLVAHCGARVINGDFAMLSLSQDGLMFEPTPFCGTSRICLNERVKVDHIVFLSQSLTNTWHDLDGRKSIVNMLSNAFVPIFDRKMHQIVLDRISNMVSMIRTSEYAFAPNKEAAALFLNMITQN